MPRPKQDKYCVSCLDLIVNPENIKKKGYACDACKRAGLVFFCGKCGFQKTPEGADSNDARCSRCRPAIHTLEYRDGKEDLSSTLLKDAFISGFRDHYSTLPHGEEDLEKFLENAYEETKKEILHNNGVSIVAVSPNNTLNKYVGFVTAQLDHSNQTAYINQAVVIKKCWGLGVLKTLAANLVLSLEKAGDFKRVYFITRKFNERVVKMATERFFFSKADPSLVPSTYSPEKYIAFLCEGDDLVKLKEKLKNPQEKAKRTVSRSRKRSRTVAKLEVAQGNDVEGEPTSESELDLSSPNDLFDGSSPPKKHKTGPKPRPSQTSFSSHSHKQVEGTIAIPNPSTLVEGTCSPAGGESDLSSDEVLETHDNEYPPIPQFEPQYYPTHDHSTFTRFEEGWSLPNPFPQNFPQMTQPQFFNPNLHYFEASLYPPIQESYFDTYQGNGFLFNETDDDTELAQPLFQIIH